MANYLTNQTVAWNYVSLNDLTQAFEVIVVANDECVSNRSALLFVPLHDINVDEMAILPELPCERDSIFTPC